MLESHKGINDFADQSMAKIDGHNVTFITLDLKRSYAKVYFFLLVSKVICESLFPILYCI